MEDGNIGRTSCESHRQGLPDGLATLGGIEARVVGMTPVTTGFLGWEDCPLKELLQNPEWVAEFLYIPVQDVARLSWCVCGSEQKAKWVFWFPRCISQLPLLCNKHPHLGGLKQ